MADLKSPLDCDKGVSDPFEWRLFYELMQQYRWAKALPQTDVIRAFEAVKDFGRSAAALASPPVAVQEEGDAKDGARYREFFASGLPITFLGVEYRTKAELDAAIDAVMGDQP